MSILSSLPILSDVLEPVLDRFFPNKEEARKAQADIERALIDNAQQLQIEQTQINKVEAAHRSVFVAGWRPSIGWVCSAALGYQFIISPLLNYGLAVFSPETPIPPKLDMGDLMTLLTGMLGLGGLRTVEKLQGVAS